MLIPKLLTAVCAAALLGCGAVVAADEEAQAALCKQTLDAMARGQPEQAADIMLQGQPFDRRDLKVDEFKMDTMRIMMRRSYESVVRQNGGGTLQGREPLPEQRFGDRIAVMERWDFANGHKPYAGCVRFPASHSWMTNIQFGPNREEVSAKLQAAAAGNPYPQLRQVRHRRRRRRQGDHRGEALRINLSGTRCNEFRAVNHAASRARSCGAERSIGVPLGMMPVGLSFLIE
jgi:hypothetical protein